MRGKRVDASSLDELLEDVLYLQYRFACVRCAVATRNDVNKQVVSAMDRVTESFDSVVDSIVDIPAVKPFDRSDKQARWWRNLV